MSKELYQAFDQVVTAMIAENAADPSVKLTYAALATRVGVSASAVKQPEYRDLRERLKAAKPKRAGVATNEDAAEWRRRFHQLQSEKATSEAALRTDLKEAHAMVERLVQKLQSNSV